MAGGAISVGGDVIGVFLLGLAAVVLAVVAVTGYLVRPRLALLSGRRIAVRTLFARHEYAASQIYRLRVVRYPRMGRRVPILEIDVRDADPADPVEQLLLLTRWDLGMNPDRVFTALEQAGLVPPVPQTP